MIAIVNADVYSVKLDGTVTRAEAVVTDGGKIALIGSNQEAKAFIESFNKRAKFRIAESNAGVKSFIAGSNTSDESHNTDAIRIIDAEGRTVLPGLCDAHVHASWSGSALFSCNLFELSGNGEKGSIVQKIQKVLKEYIDEHPDKAIIKGCGWDMFDFMKALPDKSMLDAVCSDKPVILESYDQHHVWLNSKALEMAGITKDTPQPRDGTINRDKAGEPTGLISEFSAINLVREGIPGYDYTVAEYKDILRAYQEKFAGPYGITMIFDALSSANAKAAYIELAKAGELTMRVRDNYYADPSKPESQFDDMIASKGQNDVGDDYVQNCVKFFMESGVPDTYFCEPYKSLALKYMHRPKGYRGFPFWEAEELQRILPKLMNAGFQIHTHAMGDGSVKHTVDAYEFAFQTTGLDTRNVIAHLMLVKPEDFARMGKSKMLACVQPTWMAMKKSDFKTLNMALGKKRTEQMYPYKRFLDHGVVVSAGTDFPVTPPPCPFIEMEHGLTRKLCAIAEGYEESKNLVLAPKKNPTQDIVRMQDIIQSRTINGAYQGFAEDITGSIEVGKSAELVLLDRNLPDTPLNKIHETKVLMTIFKGKVVYERP